jgi:hypothetical protein
MGKCQTTWTEPILSGHNRIAAFPYVNVNRALTLTLLIGFRFWQRGVHS